MLPLTLDGSSPESVMGEKPSPSSIATRPKTLLSPGRTPWLVCRDFVCWSAGATTSNVLGSTSPNPSSTSYPPWTPPASCSWRAKGSDWRSPSTTTSLQPVFAWLTSCRQVESFAEPSAANTGIRVQCPCQTDAIGAEGGVATAFYDLNFPSSRTHRHNADPREAFPSGPRDTILLSLSPLRYRPHFPFHCRPRCQHLADSTRCSSLPQTCSRFHRRPATLAERSSPPSPNSARPDLSNQMSADSRGRLQANRQQGRSLLRTDRPASRQQ